MGYSPSPQPAQWAWHPELTQLHCEFPWRKKTKNREKFPSITEGSLLQSAQTWNPHALESQFELDMGKEQAPRREK